MVLNRNWDLPFRGRAQTGVKLGAFVGLAQVKGLGRESWLRSRRFHFLLREWSGQGHMTKQGSPAINRAPLRKD